MYVDPHDRSQQARTKKPLSTTAAVNNSKCLFNYKGLHTVKFVLSSKNFLALTKTSKKINVHISFSTDGESDDELGGDDIRSIFKRLKTKHGGAYSEFKLNTWARMLVRNFTFRG